eukprot:9642046-Alexandrium_andersonii.AAC.1
MQKRASLARPSRLSNPDHLPVSPCKVPTAAANALTRIGAAMHSLQLTIDGSHVQHVLSAAARQAIGRAKSHRMCAMVA